MNKALSLIALCLGSAVVGGFIALRMAEHPQPLAGTATSPVPAHVTSVAPAVPAAPAVVSASDRPVPLTAAAPPVQTAMETRDDYDFDTLAGPGHALANRFEHEASDPTWAPRAIDDVSHALESQAVYTKLASFDVDCRATLCRIQASLPLDSLQSMMGPSGNFSWGQIVSNLMHAPPWNSEFDDTSDMESMDNTLGQAQFTTYLHRRPQSVATSARTVS